MEGPLFINKIYHSPRTTLTAGESTTVNISIDTIDGYTPIAISEFTASNPYFVTKGVMFADANTVVFSINCIQQTGSNVLIVQVLYTKMSTKYYG